jgi:plastocyanin
MVPTGVALAPDGGAYVNHETVVPFPDGTATAEADGTSVTIADFAFAPAEIEVAAGATVTWANEDWAPHTAIAEDGSFDSGRLDQGASFQQTFAEPGRYPYRCSFHPGMAGTVVVT